LSASISAGCFNLSYHHKLIANDSASWFGITVAWQADRISRSAQSRFASGSDADAIANARSETCRAPAHPAPASPVDGILDQRGRRIIFGSDQDAVMRADHALEIDRMLRHARFRLQVAS